MSNPESSDGTGPGTGADQEPGSIGDAPPPAFPVSDTGRPRKSRIRIALGVTLTALGLAAVAGGAVPIVIDLTREPTDAEIKRAGEKEVAVRWRTLTAAQIFPARLSRAGSDMHEKPLSPPAWTAVRAGIAPAAGCAEAFDREVARVLVKHGCRTVLRATYVDDSGTLAMTVGVVVMPDTAHASRAEADAGSSLGVHGVKERYGVRAVAFPGTAAAAFNDSLRQDFWLDTFTSPYLLFRSSGWLMSRGRPDRAQVDEDFYFARVVADAVRETLVPQAPPCERKGVRC